jgi:hypothetical protein
VWTTNGDRLIFRRTAGFFWQRADGTGPVEWLGDGIPTGVTPDGKVLFAPGRGATDLSVLALDSTRLVEALFDTTAIERNGVVSPDGHWLAYESDSEGPLQIYVVPYQYQKTRSNTGTYKIQSGFRTPGGQIDLRRDGAPGRAEYVIATASGDDSRGVDFSARRGRLRGSEVRLRLASLWAGSPG